MRKWIQFLAVLLSFCVCAEGMAASTFANASAAWRVRAGGAQTNGGCFDALVTSSGTDRTDQDGAYVDVNNSTITASSAGTTLTFASGYTPAAADIGNCFRIASGSSCTADYYVITGANAGALTWTLDRTAGAACTAIVGKMGGAHASLQNYASAATGALSTPTLSTPLIPGNRVYIRGSGSLDPGSADYNWAGTWTIPDCTRVAAGAGGCALIGYNGRPRIDQIGGLFVGDNWDYKNLSIFRSANTNAIPFAVKGSNAFSGSLFNSIIDQNGFDSTEWLAAYGHVVGNEFRNTGGGAAGTAPVVKVTHPANGVINNYLHGLRGPAIYWGPTPGSATFSVIAYNYIVNNLSDGIYLDPSTAPYLYSIFNNTIDANGGHGINLQTKSMAMTTIFNNLITNHTGTNKCAINFVDSYTVNRRLQKNVFEANGFYGNTACPSGSNFNQVSSADAWVLQATDITSDPGYANRSSGNYATGAAVRNKGISGLGGVAGTIGTATNNVNIGAWQGSPVQGRFFMQSMDDDFIPYAANDDQYIMATNSCR